MGACPWLSCSRHLHPFYTLCEGDTVPTLVLELRERGLEKLHSRGQSPLSGWVRGGLEAPSSQKMERLGHQGLVSWLPVPQPKQKPQRCREPPCRSPQGERASCSSQGVRLLRGWGRELPVAWLCCISLPGPACRCRAVIAAVLKLRQSGLTAPLPSGPCSMGAEGHVHSPLLRSGKLFFTRVDCSA